MKTNILKKTSWIIVIIIFLFSCNNQKKEEPLSLSPRAHSSTEEKLIVEIICQGRIESYQTLLDDYNDNSRLEEMLAYALIMANKHNYSQAYFDVFDILTSIPYRNASICAPKNCLDCGFFCLDDKTKQMAVDYFKQAVYKGNALASKMLLDFYDENKEFPIKELYSDKKLIKNAQDNLD